MAEAATLNLTCSWGWPRPTIKPHSEEKVGATLGYGSSQIFGVPFSISAKAALSF